MVRAPALGDSGRAWLARAADDADPSAAAPRKASPVDRAPCLGLADSCAHLLKPTSSQAGIDRGQCCDQIVTLVRDDLILI